MLKDIEDMLIIKRIIRPLKIIGRRHAIKDAIGWHGHIHILIEYSDGRYQEDEFDNLIMLDGKNAVRDTLGGFITDCKTRYVAFGTNNTAVVNTQHTLVAEGFRKAVTQYTQGSNGVVNSTVYVAPNECNISIQEIGWFAGPLAISATNSGIMIARVLWAHSKTNAENLTITRTDTFS